MRNLLLLILAASALAGAETPKTRNVILVTADGLRWQDLFGGIDPVLMNEEAAGMKEEGASQLREQLWRDTPEKRREALMPFMWGTVAAKGVVLGNVKRNSSVKVKNRYLVSYPGYAEILTGRGQDDVITGNVPVQNPSPTLLDIARERLKLERTQAALFGTWNHFGFIGTRAPGSVTINAGPQRLELPGLSPRLRELNDLQFDARVPWSSERHDYFTFEMALAYLKQFKPRVLHVAFGETDDWAHEKRYDRVLSSIGYFDRSLKKLWETVQSMPEYRGNTTLIIATDHGRGPRVSDFTGHGQKVPEAVQIWIAAMGPDTPATGEAKDTPEVYQRDITPTILKLLGVADYPGLEGKPIPALIR